MRRLPARVSLRHVQMKYAATSKEEVGQLNLREVPLVVSTDGALAAQLQQPDRAIAVTETGASGGHPGQEARRLPV